MAATDRPMGSNVRFAPLELHPQGDRQIVIRRRFAAPVPLVFDALVTPELLLRWLHGPAGWLLVECEFDATVGGRYRYLWHGPNGQTMAATGVIQEISPPDRLVTAERFDHNWTGGEVISVTELAADGRGTVLTNTGTYPSRSARDAALATGMKHGVDAGYAHLDRLLADLQPGG